MKFAITLIKAISGLLSVGLFGAFVYYTYLYQQNQEITNLTNANISLIMFLLSAVVLALLFITHDAYQTKGLGDALMKSIIEKINGPETDENSTKESLKEILQQISATGAENNQIMNSRMQEINDCLDKLNTITSTSSEQMNNTFVSLQNTCEQISSYVNIIKQEKEKEPKSDHSGDFAVLITTLSKLSSDLTNLNNLNLEALNKISTNINQIISHHNEMNDDVRAISDKMNYLHPELRSCPVTTISQPIETDEELEAPESIADFYADDFTNNTFDNNDIITDEEPVIEDIVTDEEPIVEEFVTDEEPIIEDVMTDEEPVIEDIVTDEEPIVEEFVTDEEPVIEDVMTDEEPVIEEKPKEKPTFDTDYYKADEDTIFGVPTDKIPMYEHNPNKKSELFALETDTPFGTPLSDEMPTYDPSLEPKEKIDLSFDTESQFGTSDGEGNPMYEEPEEKTSFEATDPYGIPSSEKMPTFEPPVEKEEKIDLSFDTESQFGAIPENDDEKKLETIFNEDFASEMSELDILKDEEPTQIEEDIDISTLLDENPNDNNEENK